MIIEGSGSCECGFGDGPEWWVHGVVEGCIVEEDEIKCACCGWPISEEDYLPPEAIRIVVASYEGEIVQFFYHAECWQLAEWYAEWYCGGEGSYALNVHEASALALARGDEEDWKRWLLLYGKVVMNYGPEDDDE